MFKFEEIVTSEKKNRLLTLTYPEEHEILSRKISLSQIDKWMLAKAVDEDGKTIRVLAFSVVFEGEKIDNIYDVDYLSEFSSDLEQNSYYENFEDIFVTISFRDNPLHGEDKTDSEIIYQLHFNSTREFDPQFMVTYSPKAHTAFYLFITYNDKLICHEYGHPAI